MATTKIELGIDGATGLRAQQFRVEERLSAPFRIEVGFERDDDLDPAAVLGKAGSVTWVAPDGEPRTFRGVVSRLVRRRTRREDESFRFEAVLEPAFAFLRLRRGSRIFQSQTLLEVVQAILDEHGVAPVDVSCVKQSMSPLEYCVQYQESDFDFVSRLLESAGIFYFFRHDDSGCKLVLGDCSAAFDRCAGEALEFGQGTPHASVDSWSRAYACIPGKVTRREYDWKEAAEPAEAGADTVLSVPDAALREVYTHPGGFALAGSASAAADAEMRAIEAGQSVIEGTCDIPLLQPGGTIDFDEKFGDTRPLSTDTQFLVVSATHDAGEEYRCRFECVPASVGFCPPRTTPRPRIHGVQTAIVTGPQDAELHTDDDGRVKVKFHWDRSDAADDTSSCFLRVAQPWSGAGYGAWFLPRVGAEVVVTFVDGDPDRPLVTGCVYNPRLAAPYTPGSTPNVSGIRTKSTADGASDAFNELLFDDTKDSELLVMQAQKDRRVTVKNDDAAVIGHDRTETVKNARTRTVEEGDETVTIKKGKRTVTLEEGDLAHEVTKGAYSLHAKGDVAVEVDDGDHVTKVAKGKRDVEVAQGDDVLAVKQGDQTIKVDLGKIATEAMNSIELKVGSNSIKISASGIEIKGMQVSVEGELKAELKGLMVDVKADAIASVKGALTKLG